jgi:hypothetical protein
VYINVSSFFYLISQFKVSNLNERSVNIVIFFIAGPINSLVYAVDGGMEDWMYAAGWDTTRDRTTNCTGHTKKKEKEEYRQQQNYYLGSS